jgi:nucleotide-binding universal stress UspA family protein
MTHRILLGYDGSNESQNAFTFALELARKFDADLHVVAVVQPPDFGGDVETQAFVESSRQYLDRALRALKAKLANETVKTQLEIAFGHAADQIVSQAEKTGAITL